MIGYLERFVVDLFPMSHGIHLDGWVSFVGVEYIVVELGVVMCMRMRSSNRHWDSSCHDGGRG